MEAMVNGLGRTIGRIDGGNGQWTGGRGVTKGDP